VEAILSQADPIGTEILIADFSLPREGIADHLESIFSEAKARGRISFLRLRDASSRGRRVRSRAQAVASAIDATRGTFLAFVHPADLWRTGRLARLEPLLSRHDFILSSSDPIAASASDPLRVLLTQRCGIRSSGVYRRTLLDQLGKPLPCAETADYEVWLRAILALTEKNRRQRFILISNAGGEIDSAEDATLGGLFGGPGKPPFPFGPELEQELHRAFRKLGRAQESLSLLRLAGEKKLPPRYWGTILRRWMGRTG
jgi:hypothetical protein